MINTMPMINPHLEELLDQRMYDQHNAHARPLFTGIIEP